MTLSQVTELLAYWRKHPPAHLLLGASLGLHENREREEDFAALMALAPNGVLRGGKT